MSANIHRRQSGEAPGTAADNTPDALQRRAAAPQNSAWVAASAGAGKTKVLIDRIIRLMLPDGDRPGSPPDKILALTFTKAAANEMALRLSRRLGNWAVASDDNLGQDLEKLLNRPPTAMETRAARQLFARVIGSPGGMRIMTIHSFCQSVLGRFPLEAGLPPHFRPLEEGRDSAWLQQAQNDVLSGAAAEKASPLTHALHRLAGVQDEERLKKLLADIIRERRQFKALLDKNFGVEGVYARLCEYFAVPPGLDGNALLKAFCDAAPPDETGLRQTCAILAVSTKSTDIKKGQDIQRWLDSSPDERLANYKPYKKAFLTDKDEPQKKSATQESIKAFPGILAILSAEAQRLTELEDRRKAADCAIETHDLLLLGEAVLERYETLKAAQGLLDFDDLILRTLDLLEGQSMGMTQEDAAPWVRYKLDQGIDHILIDEAQDTNPEQWDIIRALCEDFFTGPSPEAAARTLFVVGDEKQSIFSFQRAAPDRLGQMHAFFSRKADEARQTLENVPINISFRSAPAILQAVDAVFSQPHMREGLGEDVQPHIPYRDGQPGLVELWPVMQDDDSGEGPELWAPPIVEQESRSGAEKLAAHIGDTIKNWIRGGEILPARQRAVRPGDIMILVRTRTAFVGQLVRALKTRGIPVSGVDRMVLKDQLAVQDLVAAARFALLPEDDLSLAELLKSPLAGWDDDRLYAAGYGRTGSLWQAVRASGEAAAVTWLETLAERARHDRPYEFFSFLLQRPCPADAVSGHRAIRRRLGDDALDPLDEFLNRTLAYESLDVPSLQGFLHWHDRGAADIKRLMEEGAEAVRIMTVHASKGLQAPIVILPDTLRTPSSKKPARLLWPDRADFPLPLFVPSRESMASQALPVFEAAERKQEQEYRRLLYVAMTRAEDRLYVGGHCGKRPPLPESWYYDVRTALENSDGTQSLSLTAGEENQQDGLPALRLTSPAVRPPDRADAALSEAQGHAPPPEWLLMPAPAEPQPPRPLAPSRPSEESPAAASPLQKGDTYRFRRGTLTHKLLQFLPEIPAEGWDEAAAAFIGRHGRDLPPEVRNDIVRETLAVLRHPVIAPLFGPGSLAESAISGMIDGGATLISGQIDRLLITPEEVLIIDYKTNRPPPADERDIPALYRRQMRAYAAALRGIYPGRRVRCALLWTDGPRLMMVDGEES